MSATFNVNFIHHYLGVRREFYRDKRVRQSHIMVYEAIFISWNEVRWENPLLLFRDEIMKLAKVGSKTTFINCMHELNLWGYLGYFPSSSPNVSTTVEMYPLEVITANVQRHLKSGNGRNRMPVKSNTAPGPAGVPDVGISNTNNANNTNHSKSVSAGNDDVTLHTEQEDVEPAAAPVADTEKKSALGGGQCVPKNMEEVTIFFRSLRATDSQAAHFYHHYEASGWLRNGQPVKNWQALARLWLYNAHRYKRAAAEGPTPGSLQTPGTPGEKKDYDIKF